MSLVAETLRAALAFRSDESAADWLRQYFYTQDGRAFSEQSVPWVTAPHGPCWAYDSIQFREIWLQWAARMFKTNFGLGMLMRRMDQRPSETMFATPDETNCKAVFTRFWKMIGNCPRLRDQMPIEIRQSKHAIGLQKSICHGAWPRGKSRLADKSIPVGHGNEIDKWTQEATSLEGEPLRRFLKRGAEYPDRKFVLESTPSTKGKSRVELGRLSSTNHRYYVPCPHCGKFQTIEFGDGETPGGIFWERLPNGHSDRDLAKRTAHYVCAHCEGRIDDIHRPEMMQMGVWVPAGCEVDHDRAILARDLPPDDMSWLRGTPAIWGTEYGSQISVFYALFHGWGDIAYDFLGRKNNPAELRQWTNEDKGETWEIISRKQTWEQLGERLIVDVPAGVAPADHKLVTIGVDKQEDFYVYNVDSWGPGQSSHTLAYGLAHNADELFALARRSWPCENGTSLKLSAMLIDSGFRPAEVHAFVKRCKQHGLPVRACRGSSNRLNGFYEQKSTGKRSNNPGELIVWVDTNSTQDWLESRLHVLDPSQPGGMSVFTGALIEHQDWLMQMMNDGLTQSLDKANNVVEAWERIDLLCPNDYRDCKRYSFVAMLLANRGRTNNATPTKTPERIHRNPLPNFIERPGGWLKGIR